MQRKLIDLDNHGQKVRVGLVGCGKMGSGLVSQLSRIKGMRPSVIIDRHVDKCVTALRKAGVKDVDIVKTTDLKVAENAIKNNSFVVSDDYTLSYKLDMIDGVIDATGNPPFGTQLAVESIEHEKQKNKFELTKSCYQVFDNRIFYYELKVLHYFTLFYIC